MQRLMVSLGLAVISTTVFAKADDVAMRNASICNKSWIAVGATELRPIIIESNSSTTRLIITRTKRTAGQVAPAIFSVNDENKAIPVVMDIQDTGERWIYTVHPPLRDAVFRWRNLSAQIAVDTKCVSE